MRRTHEVCCDGNRRGYEDLERHREPKSLITIWRSNIFCYIRVLVVTGQLALPLWKAKMGRRKQKQDAAHCSGLVENDGVLGRPFGRRFQLLSGCGLWYRRYRTG